MWEELIGEVVVVDLRSSYVCLGTLKHVTADYLELRNADLHDLRDTETTRETYVAESFATGVKRNRKKLWLMRAEIVAVSRLKEICCFGKLPRRLILDGAAAQAVWCADAQLLPAVGRNFVGEEKFAVNHAQLQRVVALSEQRRELRPSWGLRGGNRYFLIHAHEGNLSV